MQIIHLDLLANPTLPPLALTIGNFDGVHLGHQAMLTALTQDAARLGLATAVMVFEPQPREFFNPDNPPARLTNLYEKATAIASKGVDYLLVARFDEAFRKLSASEFVALLHKLNTKHLVLGDDFRFGHDRMGDRAFLAAADFSVDSLETIVQPNATNAVRVSSTKIREALSEGDLAFAKTLLGRDYAICGVVIDGDKIGRTLNYPTANVALGRIKPAVQGIFAVDVLAYRTAEDVMSQRWIDPKELGTGGVAGLRPHSLFGAVNVGTRPSVGGTDYRLEVHLPDFVGDLYGITLEVRFLHYLHGERKYASLDELKAGIAQDMADLLAWRNGMLG